MYSDIKKGVFCERCVLFGNQQSDRNGMRMRKLFVEPFVDWKHARKRLENRMKLSPIIRCVLLCGKQNIALRGHRDDAKYLRIITMLVTFRNF